MTARKTAHRHFFRTNRHSLSPVFRRIYIGSPLGKKNFSKKYPIILKQNLCQHHSKRSRKVLKWFRDMSNTMPSDFQCIFLRKLTKFHRKSHKPPKNRQNRPARHSTNWKKLCGFQPPQKPHTATFGISYRHPNPGVNRFSRVKHRHGVWGMFCFFQSCVLTTTCKQWRVIFFFNLFALFVILCLCSPYYTPGVEIIQGL